MAGTAMTERQGAVKGRAKTDRRQAMRAWESMGGGSDARVMVSRAAASSTSDKRGSGQGGETKAAVKSLALSSLPLATGRPPAP